MRYARIDDVMEYVADNDIKFIRMQYCDMNGTLRNLSVMPSELGRAFDEGILFDPAGVSGMMDAGGEELALHPDPSTMVLLPWRPQHGRVIRFLCDIRHRSGHAYAGDGRAICARERARLRGRGMLLRAAAACSFYLFTLDERGHPTFTPHDGADAYAVAPSDKGENVRREICLTLEEMGIQPRRSFHAHGPGQHEIDLRGDEALAAADNHLTAVSVVHTIAARNGLHATMMPRPLPNAAANRLLFDMTLAPADAIADKPLDGGIAGRFWAGVREGLREIYAFLYATMNSYPAEEERRPARPDCRAVFRVDPPDAGGRARLACDPAINPYFAMALLQAAGMRGVEGDVAGEAGTLRELPASLDEALAIAGDSPLCREVLGEACLNAYLEQRGGDCAAWRAAPEPKSDWERQRYFYSI